MKAPIFHFNDIELSKVHETSLCLQVMSMETAGSLKGGKVVWALAKVKESFDIFGGDEVGAYLLFSNTHE